MNAPEYSQPLDKDRVIARLREHGINPTQQRIEIAQLLFARPQHVSADQVLGLVNRLSEKSVSKATVYNTLNLFAEVGMVREVIVDPTKVFYDSNTSEHHHYYHVDTGTLSDIPAGELQLAHPPGAPEGTQIEAVDIIVRVRGN